MYFAASQTLLRNITMTCSFLLYWTLQNHLCETGKMALVYKSYGNGLTKSKRNRMIKNKIAQSSVNNPPTPALLDMSILLSQSG